MIEIQRILSEALRVSAVHVLADNWLAIETERGFDSLALELSRKVSKGYIILGSLSIVHMVGKKAYHVCRVKDLPDIWEARAICERYTGEEAPYSVSACGRKMLGVFNDKYRLFCTGDSRKMIANTGWHCLVAKPGRYDNATIFDMKGAYWQIAQRAPSPFVNINNKGDAVSFVRVGDSIMEDWRSLLAAMAPHKLLRNGFIGAIAASKNRVYNNGSFKRNALPANPLRNFALTVVAACYEICSEASKSVGSVFSHTDCITYEGDKLPAIWSNKGIVADVKSKGETRIINIGCRKIGKDESVPYKDMFSQDSNLEFPAKAIDTTETNYNGLLYSRWVGDL